MIVGSGEAIFETAGVLGNGERVFMTAKLPEFITVKGVDKIEQYIFLTNSHDGKGCVTAAFTPVRIVCQNTLSMALANCSNRVSLRHTKNMKDKLKAAQQIMGISNLYKNEMATLFPAMAKKVISDNDFKRIVASAFTDSNATLKAFMAGKDEEVSTQMINNVKAVLEYANSNPTQLMDTTAGTVWGAYNAVTGYYQNVKEYKSDGDKIAQIIDGNVSKNVERVFDYALSYMN